LTGGTPAGAGASSETVVARLLRRVWWSLLPYAGWTAGTREERRADEADGANPPPWWAFPLAWLWRLNSALMDRLGVSAAELCPPHTCDCDFCRGVPGAVFEP
jgi:hypothetical protein